MITGARRRPLNVTIIVVSGRVVYSKRDDPEGLLRSFMKDHNGKPRGYQGRLSLVQGRLQGRLFRRDDPDGKPRGYSICTVSGSSRVVFL